MAEFLEVIENVKAEEADIQRLFGDAGSGVRHSRLREAADYQRHLVEATEFIAQVYSGKRPMYHLQEALSTDDFPLLFGDVLDRILLGNYRDFPKQWQSFVTERSVRDFRTVKRFTVDGAEGILDIVGEQEAYPHSSLSEAQYTYAVAKRGRAMPFSWETMINDDLDALNDVPRRFGRAAARSEAKFVTELYVDANGPHASFYTGGNNNLIPNNPSLSIAGLAAGFEQIVTQVDADGEPIAVEMVTLVVPPALEVTAMNIMNATQMEITQRGGIDSADGSSRMQLNVSNWMATRLQLAVDPYIPIVASSANGATSWFLFASTGEGRPALEFGRLRGHEEPEIFVKDSNARRVGGGEVNPLDGDFDRDGLQYKVRHVFGGTRLDPKATVASNGTDA